MPALTIKNIPDHLYEALRDRAKRHRRSINGEVIVCLEGVFGATRVAPEEFLARALSLRKQVKAPRLTERLLREAKKKGRP